jgi:hypothetical protein
MGGEEPAITFREELAITVEERPFKGRVRVLNRAGL